MEPATWIERVARALEGLAERRNRAMRDARSKIDCGLYTFRSREHATEPVRLGQSYRHTGNDQAEDCHDDEFTPIRHYVRPLPVGRRQHERSAEPASALLSQFLNEEHADGKQQAKDDDQE